MLKKTIKNILIWVSVISIIVILMFTMPFTVKDFECYEEIAQQVCESDGKEARFSIYDDLNGRRPVYECCVEVSEGTRKQLDLITQCERYIYLEQDHEQCTTKKYMGD